MHCTRAQSPPRECPEKVLKTVAKRAKHCNGTCLLRCSRTQCTNDAGTGKLDEESLILDASKAVAGRNHTRHRGSQKSLPFFVCRQSWFWWLCARREFAHLHSGVRVPARHRLQCQTLHGRLRERQRSEKDLLQGRFPWLRQQNATGCAAGTVDHMHRARRLCHFSCSVSCHHAVARACLQPRPLPSCGRPCRMTQETSSKLLSSA